MKKILVSLIVSAALLFGAAYVVQAAPPTKAEAKAMAEKAAAYWKANGKEKAVAEINNPHGQFTKGELYVFASEHGTTLANGGNPKLVGINSWDLKDPTGKYFAREFYEVAKKGGGWADYTYANPFTKKIQKKTAYILPVGEGDIYVACGVFE